MALIMTRVDYLFTRYTVVVPYVVFSVSSGSHVSWLPGVTMFPFMFIRDCFLVTSRRAWLVRLIWGTTLSLVGSRQWD
jgi:hypothetical protein